MMSDSHGIFSDIRILDGVLTIVETETFDRKDDDIESIETHVTIPDPNGEDVEIIVQETDIIEEIVLPE